MGFLKLNVPVLILKTNELAQIGSIDGDVELNKDELAVGSIAIKREFLFHYVINFFF